MDTIAVLMSTYNGERFLREQIDSILGQQGDIRVCLLVRDDGSSDRTQAILEEYRLSGKLEWYTGGNLGPAHSFLDLLKRYPDYEYYAFADQDDFWMPNKLLFGVKALKKIEVPGLYCANAELVDENLNSLGRNVYRAIPRTDFFTLMCSGGLLGCSMVFNNKLASLVCNEEMPGKIVLHDFYLAALCSAVGGEIIFDKCSHMKYRQHGNNVVGVSHGIYGTLISRLNDIVRRENVSIADQAETLMFLLDGRISMQKYMWLKKVSGYRKSLFSRIGLALSCKTRYMNANMGFKLRASILLGNR